ncbi:MAG: LuxR family transcriptional regulator [Desmonostoc vinosum HA7617-LM4]|jgi:DNA-binding CsgD family transcriptional regulator|nr:LuxR family transcriptional regulator [Desmonostoc vinosum HA7617-LM4]
MVNSLQSLFQAIAHARNEEELRQQIMVKVGEYFAAQRWGIFFLDQLPLVNANLPSMAKLAVSVEHNPVLRYLIKQHAPVHEGLLLSPELWRVICPRPDHGHVMAGPIVSNGCLVGGVGFTRHRDTPAFNTQDLVDLSALCLHLSTWLVTIQSQSPKCDFSHVNSLTPREIQIAELVAQGLTNAEIGSTLWIQENSVKQALKRMFRKLKVSSRAGMVAQLVSSTSVSQLKT